LFYDGLQDLDIALSPRYTTPASPKRHTAKCHFRRAKVLSVMARYDRANEDYGAFVRIMHGLAAPISPDEMLVERATCQVTVANSKRCPADKSSEATHPETQCA
jgi:hypothetical protein